MKVAIAILNWNGVELLKTFLPSIVDFSQEADIYVIDNASQDESISLLKENFPSVNIIEHADNLGFCEGYNQAVPQIEADVIGILNNDIGVSENWLSPLIKFLENNSNTGIVQPKILSYKEKDEFEYAGAAGGFIDNLGYPYCQGRVFWTLEKDENQFQEITKIHWSSGACMFIRKEIFLQLKGFDSDFFAHQEEIDLCWRLRNLGKEIYFIPDSKVYHLGNATLSVKSPQKTYLNFRNNLFLLVKNLPANQLYPKLFIRLVLDGITALVFLRYEGFKHFYAIFRAHMSFYKGFPKMLKKREKNNSLEFIHCTVPWQYFIRKRKKFSDLK